MTINHVHLAARNLADTRAFYEQYFGFRVEQPHGDGVFLRDSTVFLIALDPTEDRAQFPKWFHLGFCLKSAAEVRALHSKLEQGGARIIRGLLEEPSEFASFFIADPDGVRIEVSWHAE